MTRPTAKGIFGNLHLWFHASCGKPVEKDYADLCNLLNVQAYPHLSKIKSTMGLALNELMAIKYIFKWDVQKMSSKLGYKVVLIAGEELLRILDSSRPERRDAAPAVPLLPATSDAGVLSPAQETAIALLREYGVLPAKAASLVIALGPDTVTETVGYLTAGVLSSSRKEVENPAGLIIYSLEKGLQVPPKVKSLRKGTAPKPKSQDQLQRETERLEARLAYSEWVKGEEDRVVRAQFSQAELDQKLLAIVAELNRTDPRFSRMPGRARINMARITLRKELAKDAALPTFEEWQSASAQTSLF